jgi:hypothetical protein
VEEVAATRDLSILYVHEYGASPNTFHTQVLKAAIEETCLCSYVYIVRIQMEVPECELGVRITVTALWDVTCTVGGRYEPFAPTFRVLIFLGISAK